MTSEERAEMIRLCQQIAVEQDRDTFTKLIQELNDLLSRKDHRLEERDKHNP
jgi:hypothetical protein